MKNHVGMNGGERKRFILTEDISCSGCGREYLDPERVFECPECGQKCCSMCFSADLNGPGDILICNLCGNEFLFPT
jgi:hypothetical protein